MTFVEHRRGKNQILTSSMENEGTMLVKHPCKITGGNSFYQSQLPKLTNGKKQMVKIYYLPFLFIEYLEFSKKSL